MARNFPPGTGCYCPGDCACNAPAWMSRPVFCGCRQHPEPQEPK